MDDSGVFRRIKYVNEIRNCGRWVIYKYLSTVCWQQDIKNLDDIRTKLVLSLESTIMSKPDIN